MRLKWSKNSLYFTIKPDRQQLQMKFLKYLFALSLCATILSCSSDDDVTQELSGENNLTIEFDNSVNGDDLLLGTSSYTNSNGETLTINRFNYIVSNFVLIDAEGNEYVYPKDDSYFVVSEEEAMNEVVLENIPAGDYVAMRFGVGVDQEKYLQGAAGQGDRVGTGVGDDLVSNLCARTDHQVDHVGMESSQPPLEVLEHRLDR